MSNLFRLVRTRAWTNLAAVILPLAGAAASAHAVIYTDQVREVTAGTLPSGTVSEREALDFGPFSRTETLEETLQGTTLTATGFHASALQTDLLSFDLGASVLVDGPSPSEELQGLGSALFSVAFLVSEPTIAFIDVNAGVQATDPDTLATATISLGLGSSSLFLLEVSGSGSDSRQQTLTLEPGTYRFVASINHAGREGNTFAAGVVTFTPVPTPGVMGVLGIAGVLAARRKR